MRRTRFAALVAACFAAALIVIDSAHAAEEKKAMANTDPAIAAIDKESPRLMWLSVSSIGDTAQFLADYRRLQKKASERGTAILVGGRALTDAVRREMTYSAFCDNLQHVVTFATTIYRRPEPVPGRSGAVTAV